RGDPRDRHRQLRAGHRRPREEHPPQARARSPPADAPAHRARRRLPAGRGLMPPPWAWRDPQGPPPPSWPAGEPWPPAGDGWHAGGRGAWPANVRRFRRRAILIAFTVLVAVIAAGIALGAAFAWHRSEAPSGGQPQHHFAPMALFGVAFFIALIAGIATA